MALVYKYQSGLFSAPNLMWQSPLRDAPSGTGWSATGPGVAEKCTFANSTTAAEPLHKQHVDTELPMLPAAVRYALRSASRGSWPSDAAASAAETAGISPNAPKNGAGASGGDFRCASGMRLELTQNLELSQLTLSFIPPLPDYQGIHAAAEKIRFTKYGLNVEAAVVGRYDLLELLAYGSAGMMIYGLPFVMKDYYVHLDERFREAFSTLIAVHEWGESVFGDHHKASLLEFAVAWKEGILDEYLKFLDTNYLLKYRDTVLHRLVKDKEIKDKLKKGGVDVSHGSFAEPSKRKGNGAVRAAESLIEEFQRSDKYREIAERYEEAFKEDLEVVKIKTDEWISYITAFEQIRSFFHLAAVKGGEALGPAGRRKDQRLELRLALFRVLGVMAYEIDEGILGTDGMDGTVKDMLVAGFMEELRGAIGENQIISSDPLFEMDWEQMMELALADSAIWNNGLGMEMRLNGDKKDGQEAVIESERRRAWEEAMGAGALSAKEQAKLLNEHAAGLKGYSEFYSGMEETLQHLGKYGIGSPFKEYLDINDFVVTILAKVQSEIQGVISRHAGKPEISSWVGSMQEAVSGSIRRILKKSLKDRGYKNRDLQKLSVDLSDVAALAGSLGGEDFTAENIRLAYLSTRFANTGDKRMIGRIVGLIADSYFKKWDSEGGFSKDAIVKGIIKRRATLGDPLVERLLRASFEARSDDLARIFAPDYGMFVFLQRFFPDSATDVFFAMFIRQIAEKYRENTGLVLRAVCNSRVLWEKAALDLAGQMKELKGRGNIGDLFPGQTPEAVWDIMALKKRIRQMLAGGQDVMSVLQGVDRTAYEAAVFLYESWLTGEDYKRLPLDEDDASYMSFFRMVRALDDLDGWRELAFSARVYILNVSFLHHVKDTWDPLFQFDAGILSSVLREKLVAHYRKKFGATSDAIEERLSPFNFALSEYVYGGQGRHIFDGMWRFLAGKNAQREAENLRFQWNSALSGLVCDQDHGRAYKGLLGIIGDIEGTYFMARGKEGVDLGKLVWFARRVWAMLAIRTGVLTDPEKIRETMVEEYAKNGIRTYQLINAPPSDLRDMLTDDCYYQYCVSVYNAGEELRIALDALPAHL